VKLPDFRKMRSAMIDSQLRPSGIVEPNLIAAIKYVPREMYVPAELSSLAYLDEALEVVPGRAMPAPLVGCLLMSALEVAPTERALIVGGEASYALYLLHMPILIGWKGVSSALQGRDSHYVLAWWEVGSLLVITLAAALALHVLFEGPARTWIRRQADRFWPQREAKAQMQPGSQPPDV